MKILIVSDARSTHTRRWVKSLNDAGVKVVLFSPNRVADDFFVKEGIKLYLYDLFSYKGSGSSAPVKRILSHIGAMRSLKRAIKIEQPELLHAHYLTSYALIAALAGFHPLMLSVWGSDIYEFPKLSLLNRLSVKYVLSKAERVCSTSHIMAREIAKYYKGEITVIPFGVDTTLFRKLEEYTPQPDSFVVGCVKSLSQKYGIDIAIRAFKMVQEHCPHKNLKMVIVGEGPDSEKYKELAKSLNIKEIQFMGKVENSLLPPIYNSFSVALALSRSESFGVAALEAMACECPVITSDADGFTEVIEDGVTGIIVPREDVERAAMAMERFINEPQLRESMGRAGRERVVRLYSWADNIDTMVGTYKNSIAGYEQ